jgi:hypothetical protein
VLCGDTVDMREHWDMREHLPFVNGLDRRCSRQLNKLIEGRNCVMERITMAQHDELQCNNTNKTRDNSKKSTEEANTLIQLHKMFDIKAHLRYK